MRECLTTDPSSIYVFTNIAQNGDKLTPVIITIVSIALHHMNLGSSEKHVYLVPDTLETFGGIDSDLLPSLFVRLLLLCLRANWRGISGHDRSPREFVEQFAIVARMTWMKTHVRKILEDYTKEPTGAWLNRMPWLYPALRID